MSSFSDSALPPDTIDRARTGDENACEAIYRAFERPVRTLARRLVPRRAAAEDLAQDVFVEVLASVYQFDGRGSFAGWIRSITVRKCGHIQSQMMGNAGEWIPLPPEQSRNVTTYAFCCLIWY